MLQPLSARRLASWTRTFFWKAPRSAFLRITLAMRVSPVRVQSSFLLIRSRYADCGDGMQTAGMVKQI